MMTFVRWKQLAPEVENAATVERRKSSLIICRQGNEGGKSIFWMSDGFVITKITMVPSGHDYLALKQINTRQRSTKKQNRVGRVKSDWYI